MARYLLIAAYMASYNPAKMDSRLFGDMASLPKSRRKFTHADVNPSATIQLLFLSIYFLFNFVVETKSINITKSFST